jgi:hypothetical protein
MSFALRNGAAALAVSIALLIPVSAQAQNLCAPPGVYVGNNVYVQRGLGVARYYYWSGLPGAVPVLIRTVQAGQTVTTVTPTLPVLPGLPPTVVTTTTTTTQTTVVGTPVPPIAIYPPRPIVTPVVPVVPRPLLRLEQRLGYIR